MTVNEELFNRGVRHAMLLEGLKDAEVARIGRFMAGPMQKDMVDQIMTASQIRNAPARAARYKRISKNLVAISKDSMSAIMKDTVSTLNDLGTMSATFASESLTNAIPFKYAPTMPGPNMLRAVVRNEPMNGKLVTTWFKELGEDLGSKVSQQINLGIVAGDSVDDMVRRIRGTRMNRYMDGVIGASRRNVEAVVRTQMTHVSNRSRSLLYEGNRDVIKGVQYVATLDSRTTDTCAGLDGKVFKPTEGPRPPLHIRCRSTTVPITKSWDELSKEFKSQRLGKVPESKVSKFRESMNGSVSGKTTYARWLKQQPVELQNMVLGKKRAELFREGRVHLTRFTNYGTFPPKELTIEQLLDLERTLGVRANRINEQIQQFLVKPTKARPPIERLAAPPPEPAPPPKPDAPKAPTKNPADMNGRELRNYIEEQLDGDPDYLKFLDVRAKERRLYEERRLRIRACNDKFKEYKRAKNRIVEDPDEIARLLKEHDELLKKYRAADEAHTASKEALKAASDKINPKIHKMMELPPERRSSFQRKIHKRKETATDATDTTDVGGRIANKELRSKVEEADDFMSRLIDKDAIDQQAGDSFTYGFNQLRGDARAYHWRGTVHVAKSDSVNTIVHEVMHAVEFHRGDQLKSSIAFLKRRARNSFAKDPKRGQNLSFRETISPHYDPRETGIVDDFTTPYIGKVYKSGWTDNFRSSEILSMGVGDMVDDAAYMLKADPDFFEHIVDRMRGIRGRNFGRGNDFTDDVLELGSNETFLRIGGFANKDFQ